MEDMYCTGHSLGGHVCGHAGQRANYYGNFGRITGIPITDALNDVLNVSELFYLVLKDKIFLFLGLDPAGPWFENIDHPDAGLDKTDALTVDVMHTHGVKKVVL